MTNVKILPESPLNAEVLIFCPYLRIFVRPFDYARRAAETDLPTVCMQVVNRLNPKLVSSQFYSQIEVARTWVGAAIQDLMDTGAIEYTPGHTSTCIGDEQGNKEVCKGIAKVKRNTSNFPCGWDYGFYNPDTGEACDRLQDIFGARFSNEEGWSKYHLTPMCTYQKTAKQYGVSNIDSLSMGADFPQKMRDFYDTADWSKCSRSVSSPLIVLHAICCCACGKLKNKSCTGPQQTLSNFRSSFKQYSCKDTIIGEHNKIPTTLRNVQIMIGVMRMPYFGAKSNLKVLIQRS